MEVVRRPRASLPSLRSLPGSGHALDMPEQAAPREVRLISPRTTCARSAISRNHRANVASLGVEATGLVQRIVATLSSPATFTAVALKLFSAQRVPTHAKTADRREGEDGLELPLAKLSTVLSHWHIREEHLPLFWALLRKQPAHWESKALPESISFEDFQAVLLKFLRRIRDKYCGVRMDRHRFVTQNSLRFEDAYSVRGPKDGLGLGKCFQVVHRKSKLRRMCKLIPKEGATIPMEEVAQELNTLKMLDHPNIVRIFEWFESADAFFLIMEAARGGDLGRLLAKAKSGGSAGLEEVLVQRLTVQAVTALAYIHSKRVVHRDVKPSNFLLLVSHDHEVPRLLLADFGISELFVDSAPVSSSVRGTLGYLAPEVFDDCAGPRADVWSLGIVVYESLCGNRPFTGETLIAMYSCLRGTPLNSQPIRDVGGSEEAIAFLDRVLSKDVAMRPSATKALADAWFSAHPPPSSPGRRAAEIDLAKAVSDYISSGHFSQVALTSVASQIDTARIEGLTQIFEAFDTDRSGWISREELAAGLREVGSNDLDYLAEGMDLNGDSRIDYSEFVACLLRTQQNLIEDVLHHSFCTFDVNNDGVISPDELRLMLGCQGSLAAVLPDGKTVDEVFAEICTSGSGAISFEEFKAYIFRERDAASTVQSSAGPSADHESRHSDRLPSLVATDALEPLLHRARHTREQAAQAAADVRGQLPTLSHNAAAEKLRSLLHEQEALWSKLADVDQQVAALLPEISMSNQPAADSAAAKPDLAAAAETPTAEFRPKAPQQGLPLPRRPPPASCAMNRTTGNRWHILSLGSQSVPSQAPVSARKRSASRQQRLPPVMLTTFAGVEQPHVDSTRSERVNPSAALLGDVIDNGRRQCHAEECGTKLESPRTAATRNEAFEGAPSAIGGDMTLQPSSAPVVRPAGFEID